MNRLVLIACAALLAAGCKSSKVTPHARFNGPLGVAAYHGYTSDFPGALREYIAVANTRGDELRLIDAQTDKTVLSPTLVTTLAVPVLPRPIHVAAGSLHDVDGTGSPVALADLLVVASNGLVARDPVTHPGEYASRLQVVRTWDATPAVALDVDLGDVAPEEEILTMVVGPVPVPDGAGGYTASPGKARVYLGMTGGLLAVVEVVRADATTGAIAPSGTPVAQTLGFQVPSLALGPDRTRLYAASTDPLPGGVLGVAELDVTPDAHSAPDPFPVRPLSALAPTTLVTAMMVQEFTSTQGSSLDTFGPPVLRVYATLADGFCGRQSQIGCGLATIDPATGTLASDPGGELPYRVPMEIPGTPVAILSFGPPEFSSVSAPNLLSIAPGSGQRWTTGMIMLSTTAGRVYWADPAHFATPSDLIPIFGPTSAGMVGGSTVLPGTADGLHQPEGTLRVGLWDESKSSVAGSNVLPTKTIDPLVLPYLPKTTPGYLENEVWSIAWQGPLPVLQGRTAMAYASGNSIGEVAMQVATGLTGPGTAAWRDVVRVYDPRLGVRVGDLVVVKSEVKRGDGTRYCTTPFDLVITAILPPSADRPGGSFATVPAPDQETYTVVDDNGLLIRNSDGSYQTAVGNPACLSGAGDTSASASVLTSGLVLVGSQTGHAGRPDVVTADPELVTPFELRYQSEAGMSCPILTSNAEDWPPPPAGVAACEADPAACRANCEQLLLNRKARRFYYVTDGCAAAGDPNDPTGCKARMKGYTLAFPGGGTGGTMPLGPVISFKVAYTLPKGEAEANPPATLPPRGAYLALTSQSGVFATSRHPYNGTVALGAVLPGGLTLHDRSASTLQPTPGQRVFAAFPDNVVLDFGTDELSTNSVSIR